jgi:hypothetical protein
MKVNEEAACGLCAAPSLLKGSPSSTGGVNKNPLPNDGGGRSEMEAACHPHAASSPTGKKLPPTRGSKKENRMGRRVIHMPPPSSLTTQEKNPPTRGVNEVKRGAACG